MRDSLAGLGRSTSVPWTSGTFYIVLSCTLMGVMGVSLITPVLPDIRTVLGLTEAQASLVLTVYTLPGIVLSPFVGLVADRFGRRRTLLPLLFLFGTTGTAIAFVRNFEAVLLLRFLQGVGASGLVSMSITLIGDFYEGHQQNAVIGLNGTVAGSGAALYPLIGGALATIHWTAPFFMYAIGVVVGAVAVFTLPEPEGIRPTDVRTYVSRLGGVLRNREALAVLGALFLAYLLLYGGVQTAAPFLLRDVFDQSAGDIGLWLGLSAIATAALASQYGRLARWRTGPELMSLGFVVYGVSFVGVWLAPSPVFVGASLFVFGAGFGIIIPAVDKAVMTLVSKQLRAGVVGARTSIIRLGQTVGPVAFTALGGLAFSTQNAGYRTLMLLSGIGTVVLGVVVYAVLRR